MFDMQKKSLSTLLAAVALSFTLLTSIMAGPEAPSSGNGPLVDVVAVGWYAGWLGEQLPPNQIPWAKYSALTFAFAVTTPDPAVISLDSTSADLLPTFVQEAHNHNVLALLSIGGWTGSIYYSTAVGDASNRTAFVKAVVGLAQKYNLDGIDFDWEYPGKQGLGCNVVSDSDSSNFLSFLQELRQDAVGSKLKLTAAVGLAPFVGMSDVSAFASQLDHIAIMNYDVWGSSSSGVGPNAPLDDACATEQHGSATSAVKAWTAAGFPSSKIVLAVGSYGHSFYVTTANAVDASGSLAVYPPFDQTKQPSGDADGPSDVTNVATTDICGNPTNSVSGIFTFRGMVSRGFLDDSGGPAQGIDYRFDDCSQTPFVYKRSTQTMISFDDAKSFAAKGKFIKDNHLAGFAVWEIGGDYNNILHSAISDAMGIANRQQSTV